MDDRLQVALVDALSELFESSAPVRRRVRLLLGTDEGIEHERRVAFAPRHLVRLRSDLERLGLEVEITFIEGAGERAAPPFTDAEFRAAGATPVSLEASADLEPLDVVHALKEPTEYEAALPGPFLRLGALHLASRPPGVCRMLLRKNFAAILDGATVGDCSYLLTGGDRTPIVGSMSRFAGAVAGRKVAEAVDAARSDGRGIGPGKVVVVGAGIAGRSAIRKLVAQADPMIVVDPWEPSRERLKTLLPSLGVERFEIVEALRDEHLDDAIGLVFAHRTGARAAEKVCDLEQIRRMREGGAIADIAIDQGGSIAHPGYDEDDDAITARAKYQELLGDRFTYYAEVNMPREEPREASELHGDSSLPYVTALLALCARYGDASAVVETILEHPRRPCETDLTETDGAETDGAETDRAEMDRSGTGSAAEPSDPSDTVLQAVLQDLRNGVQIVVRDGEVEITDPQVAEEDVLVRWVRQCASPTGV